MKKTIKHILLFCILPFLLSNCATIVGGSKYFAHVRIDGHPDAGIFVNNRPEGRGSAVFQVQRKQANKFSITVKEEGCEDQNFNYRTRTFRGWALVGSLATFTYYVIPVGVFVDLLNGSYWKPNLFEKGISKMDYKHYGYAIDYTGCKTKENKQVIISEPKPTLINEAKIKAERLREMKKLLDDGILTSDEYEKEKKKILEEK